MLVKTEYIQVLQLAYRQQYAYFPASPIRTAPLLLLAQRYLVGGISLSGMKT